MSGWQAAVQVGHGAGFHATARCVGAHGGVLVQRLRQRKRAAVGAEQAAVWLGSGLGHHAAVGCGGVHERRLGQPPWDPDRQLCTEPCVTQQCQARCSSTPLPLTLHPNILCGF